MPSSGTIFRATGPPDHWITTLVTGIWGFVPSNESDWNKLEQGDVIVFHSTKHDSQDDSWLAGVIGYGIVDSRGQKDYPLWRSEVRKNQNQYPYIVYLSETAWRGAVDDVEPRKIDEKSEADVHLEIKALLENCLKLAEIESELDYKFPTRGALSGMAHDEAVLELLKSEPLSRIHYRDSDRSPGDSDGDGEVSSRGEQVDLGPYLSSPDLELDEAALFDGLYFPREQRNRIASTVESALDAGKHVVFTGPPGTGKTELAENVCRELASNRGYTGYQIATATADWSTFDTVGGYMPRGNADGSLEFKPGQILKRFIQGETVRNEPLVIDEINRADIDKAFGQLFTVLSGQPVQLPFEHEGREIEVIPSEQVDPGARIEPHQYVVPESWRLLATMNSYDKTSLYEMSYAFMRRFAFVRVGVPATGSVDDAREQVEAYLEYWPSVEADSREIEAIAGVWHAANEGGRKIGPALVRDMLEMVAADNDQGLDAKTTQAVVSYVLPQLEGVTERNNVVKRLLRASFIDRDELLPAADEMLHVDLTTDG